MKNGQEVIRTPETITDVDRVPGEPLHKPMKGTVVFIHPKGRYHVVEFKVARGVIRESFPGVPDEEDGCAP